MDNIIDDIAVQIRRCENASKILDREPLRSQANDLSAAANKIGEAWCKSWPGYHSRVYYANFQKPRPGEVFDPEFGLMSAFSNRTSNSWVVYDYEYVVDVIVRMAGGIGLVQISEASEEIEEVFQSCKEELRATLDALLASKTDNRIETIRDQIDKLMSHVPSDELMRYQMPRQMISRDQLAMSQAAQGIQCPPHLSILYNLFERKSYATKVGELAKLGRQAKLYLEKSLKLKGATVAKTSGKIFIGHGRSSVWKDLKDYLQDRLRLTPDEYNLQASAGLPITDRLQQMLDDGVFAFLVMTAEDQHADSTLHARENVIHEAGLFQGRLGFRRAIILLEEGCKEFSNIHGLGQIRFPKGDIKSIKDELRQVLEREGII